MPPSPLSLCPAESGHLPLSVFRERGSVRHVPHHQIPRRRRKRDRRMLHPQGVGGHLGADLQPAEALATREESPRQSARATKNALSIELHLIGTAHHYCQMVLPIHVFPRLQRGKRRRPLLDGAPLSEASSGEASGQGGSRFPRRRQSSSQTQRAHCGSHPH